MQPGIKRGLLEKIAWYLLALSAVITITSAILFFWKRSFSSELTIDASVFGQFGDVIGGVVGTLVALVSFFLLYETLNEQRRQFLLQSKEQKEQFLQQMQDTNNELLEQKKQIQKQNEDQIFYHLLDRQQNRIINIAVQHYGSKVYGYEAFKVVLDTAADIYRKMFLGFGVGIVENNVFELDNTTIAILVERWFHTKGWKEMEKNNQQYNLAEFELYKVKFYTEILETDTKDRWMLLRFKLFIDEPFWRTLEDATLQLSYFKFHQRWDSEIRNQYKIAFEQGIGGNYHLLEGYFNEVQFLCERIELATNENSEFYSNYFLAQLTSSEKGLLYYFLLSGKAKKSLWSFAKKHKLFAGITEIIPHGDKFPDVFFERDTYYLDSLYKVN